MKISMGRMFYMYWGFFIFISGIYSQPEHDCDNDCIVVHFVPHSHCDPGWLKTYDEYYEEKVQFILTTVMRELNKSEERRFIWAETCHFARWFSEQPNGVMDLVKELVLQERLEFVGGGWVQNDEAVTDYQAIINQMTLGHEFLAEYLDVHPRWGWQIDPFGASSLTPLLWKRMGFEGIVINRIPYSWKESRRKLKRLQFYWDSSNNFRGKEKFFTHILYDHYSWDPNVKQYINSANVSDDIIEAIGKQLVEKAKEEGSSYVTSHVMFPWGDNFAYLNAQTVFQNTERIMNYMNTKTNGKILTRYSTLEEYFDAVMTDLNEDDRDDSSRNLTTFNADFLPYADANQNYWTGFYSTLPSLKATSRMSDAISRASEITFALSQLKISRASNMKTKGLGPIIGDDTNKEDQAISEELFSKLIYSRQQNALIQHHEAITGTSLPSVTQDYLKRLSEGIKAATEVLHNSTVSLLSKKKASELTLGIEPICSLPKAYQTKVIPLVLFNSLGWQRTTIQRLLVPTENIMISDPSGQPVLVQIIKRWNSSSIEALFETLLPPLGYETYFLHFVETKSPYTHISTTTVYAAEKPTGSIISEDSFKILGSEPIILESDYYEIKFGENGLLKSLRNKEENQRIPLTQRFMNYRSESGGAYVFKTKPPSYTWNWFPVGICYMVGFGIAKILVRYTSLKNKIHPSSDTKKGFGFSLIGGILLSITFVALNFDVKDLGLSLSIILAFFFGIYLGLFHGLLIAVGFGAGLVTGISFGLYSQAIPDLAEPIVLNNLILVLYQGPLVDEATLNFLPGISETIRLYNSSSILRHATEIIYDVLAPDTMQLVTRYETQLSNSNGIFYTDNGLEMKMREFKYLEPIEANYFPMIHTSYIRDNERNLQFTVLTAQSMGVTSPSGGGLELMLQRHILSDDNLGLGQGIRDTNRVEIVTWNLLMDIQSSQQTRHKLSKMLNNPSQLMCGTPISTNSLDLWNEQYQTHYTPFLVEFPENVHILSFEIRNNKLEDGWKETVLRLHHMFEYEEHPVLSDAQSLDLNALFEFNFTAIEEVELSLLGDHKPSNSFVTLKPMDFKTFLVTGGKFEHSNS